MSEPVQVSVKNPARLEDSLKIVLWHTCVPEGDGDVRRWERANVQASIRDVRRFVEELDELSRNR